VNRLVRLFGASVGRKLVAASTGALLLAFLFGHMFGNLQVFQGPEVLNGYAAWLQGHPLLWVFRIGLLAVFVVHVAATLSLAAENRAARPVGYRCYRPQAASLASRTMAVSGVIIFAFVVYHLLHFTFGVVTPPGPEFAAARARLDVHAMIVQSFRNPWICGSYVVAMGLLGLHLLHGAVSAFQTFGVHHDSYSALIRGTCLALVAALVLGNCSIPILIYLGRLTPAGG